MYIEEIEYFSAYSDENTNKNAIRNAYFENRNCLANVLDFLNQEVVIIPGPYFSYPDGLADMQTNEYAYYDPDEELEDDIFDVYYDICEDDGYHLSVLDEYITIVSDNERCIFTNKDMENGSVIGTIFWVENYSELLKKFADKNLKMISKAIINPHQHRKNEENQDIECLDFSFFFSLKVYQPEVIFKYTIDSYMSNVCLDVYTKLKNVNLNSLVDKYVPDYKTCDNYDPHNMYECFNTKLCKCGGLRHLCYLNLKIKA